MKKSGERVAIVTGASSGIGMALAERAVRAGWNVLAVGRRAERLAELAATVERATGTLATLSLDLRSPKAAARIAQAALDRFGRIDVLINNAGGVGVGSIAEQSDAALYEQMETHVIVPLALTREALPALRASKGQVFFVGSGVARIPVSSLGAYPPAKAAVRNMARVVRSELRPFGITVTYVDPGAVASEFMTRAGFAGPPASLAASPYAVARKIFKAFHRRQDVVNAVPWQTFCVAIGEALPNLTDYILRRAPQLVVGDKAPSPVPPAAPAQPHLLTLAGELPHERAAESPFDAALSAYAARMKKFNLSASFVRGILVPDARLELGDVAMRWAGMPNKHERALTNDVLDALASAGFLEHVEPERYRVVRSPD